MSGNGSTRIHQLRLSRWSSSQGQILGQFDDLQETATQLNQDPSTSTTTSTFGQHAVQLQLNRHHLTFRCTAVTANSISPHFYLHLPYALIAQITRLGGSDVILLFTRTHDIWRINCRNSVETQQLLADLRFHLSGGTNGGVDPAIDLARAYALHQTIGKSRPQFAYSPRVVMDRWQMPSDHWRISDINMNFQLTETMFPQLIVPASIHDSMLLSSAQFRSLNRFPHVVYHHARNKAILVRSSQPMTGSKQRRSIEDEQYIQSILWPDVSHDYVLDKSKLPCVVDVRTKNNAAAAKLRGGGHEADGNYTGVRMFFTSIETLTVIRDAYLKLVEANRDLEMGTSTFLADVSPWLKQVQSCLRPSCFIAKTIATDGASCLIHCDDGLDLTSVLVSCAKIMIDPFYRTLVGFQHLIEEDWIQSGYPFVRRSFQKSSQNNPIITTSTSKSSLSILGQDSKLANQIANTLSTLASNLDAAATSTLGGGSSSTGNAAMNNGNPELNFSASIQFTPIFLLFLDCVYQMLVQFPVEFEFTPEYLLCIYEGTLSSKFGTFIGNSPKEYAANIDGTVCFWSWISQPDRLKAFLNHAYMPTFKSVSNGAGHVPSLPVSTNSKAIRLWSGMYQAFDPRNSSVNYHKHKWIADWAIYMTPKISSEQLLCAEQLQLRDLLNEVEVVDTDEEVVLSGQHQQQCEKCGPICFCNINASS